MFTANNKTTPIYIIILILAFQNAHSYTLDGNWNLQPSSLNYTTTDSNIQFQFRKIINSESQIVYQLTVTTCRTMFYTYTLQQNTFAAQFRRFGNNTKLCQDNSVNDMRSNLQGVFYFSINGKKLTFIYPSRQIAFILYKNSSSIPQSIKGQWQTISVNGKNITNDINIKENDIILCDGNANLSYSIFKNNSINVKENSILTAECNSSQVVETLLNSQYYLKQNNTLRLYSNGVQVILVAKNAPVAPEYKPIATDILQNKWYIYSVNGSTLVDSYYYYFLIITQNRFRFYGGCHVQFSFYNLSQGYKVTHRNVNYVNQAKDCRYINDDLTVLTNLFNRGTSLTYDSTTKILSFFDQKGNNVMQFTTQLPKIQDIYPPSSIA